jgi:PAS domain S-box-containing protein
VRRLEGELAARPAEDRRRRAEEQYRTPLDEMTDYALFMLDPEGRAATWNEGVMRMLGYERSEFLGRPVADLYPLEDRASGEPDRELAEAGEQGRSGSERWLVRKDGGRLWVSESTSSVRSPTGELLGYAKRIRDLSGIKRAEDELRRQQEALELAHEAAGLGTWDYDLTTGEIRSDARAKALAGVPADAEVTYERWVRLVHPDDLAHVVDAWYRALEDLKPFSAEYRVVRPDGSVRWLAALGRATGGSTGEAVRITGVVMDITERRQAEERLQDVLRLEATGRLAGGVAHDLNNMLSAILGYSSFLAQSFGPDDPRRADVDQIAQAAARSAGLTRQLLAFARREMVQPRPLALNAIVRHSEGMMRMVAGDNVELSLQLSAETGVVYVDPRQVEQILMNLVLNARDAMPAGGRIKVETAGFAFGQPGAPTRFGADAPEAGRYAMLSVSDTGHGMDAATLQRIWEPFFTTKPVGQGTGLGLAAVYGAVKQGGGFVWAESEPGRGTVMSVYWPQAGVDPEELDQVGATAPLEGGAETVLVVEDEPQVRALAVRTLTALGYRCLEAREPAEALRLFGQEHGGVDLVITDVVMPGMSGGELGARLALVRPALPVLYTSGYSDEDVIRRGLLAGGRPFLQKPFAPEDLARKVREVLDAAARASAPATS